MKYFIFVKVVQKHSQKAIFMKVFMDLHENNCFREGVEKTLTESM